MHVRNCKRWADQTEEQMTADIMISLQDVPKRLTIHCASGSQLSKQSSNQERP